MNDFVVGVKLNVDGRQYVNEVNAAAGANDKLGQSLGKVAAESGKLSGQQGNQATLFEKQQVAGQRLNEAYQKMVAAQELAKQSTGATAQSFNAAEHEVSRLRESASTAGDMWKTYAAQNKDVHATQILMGESAVAVGKGMHESAAGGLAAAFSSAQARRELIVLGHEAITGNFSRMPGSFMVLASRIGLTGEALVSTLGPLAAVAAIAVGVAKAFADGATEAREMNSALAITSNYAGQTRGQMRELAQGVADAGTLTVGTSKQIVTELVASGKIGAQSIGAVAKLADDYAAATGRDIDKIAPELVKLFADPAKGAAELNKQMHFVTAAELEHMAQLERSNQVGEAQLLLAQKLSGHLIGHNDQLGTIGRTLNTVKKTWSEFWDAAMGAGRTQTLEEKLADANKQVAALMSRRGASPAQLKAATSNRDDLQGQVSAGQANAVQQASHAAVLDEQNRVVALTEQLSRQAQIAAVKKNIADIDAMVPTTTQQMINQGDARIVEAKKLQELQRGMGAESRALQQGQIEGDLSLRDIDIKMAQEKNDSLLKLGAINEEEHTKQRFAFELDKNASAQLAVTQLAGRTNLNAAERQGLDIRSALLKAQAADITLAGTLADQIVKHNMLLREQTATAASLATYAAAEEASQAKRDEQQGNFNTKYSELVKQVQFETTLIGKTRAEAELLTAQRNIQLDFTRASVGLGDYELAQLSKNRDNRLAELTDNEGIKASRQGLQDQTVKDAAETKRLNEEISRGLVDSIFRGFESGKGIAQNFWDSMKNLAKTTILTPIIKFLISPITGAVTSGLGSLGISGLANAASGASGASSLSGLFGLESLGTAFGNFGTSIATYTTMVGEGYAATTALSAATAGLGASLMAVAPYLGVALFAAQALGLFGGGDHSTHGTGYNIVGSANKNQGFSGAFFGLSASDEAQYRDPLANQASLTSTYASQFAQATAEMQKLARFMGLDTASFGNKSFGFNATGPLDMGQTVQMAVLQVTDQMAQELVPNIKALQQANESLTQTFIRLAGAARDATITDAANRIGAAFNLADQWKGIAWSDLNPFPMTSAQKLGALAGEYNQTLTGARGGDLTAYNNLSGSAKSYLEQARAEYASSKQYSDIYSTVQSDVNSLITASVAEQTNRLAGMGLSLTDIAGNTKDLDKKIASLMQTALANVVAASNQIVASNNQIIAALNHNTAVTQQAATETGLVMASAASAGLWNAPAWALAGD